MGKLCQIFQNGSYHYYERDYLGSTRAVLAEDGTLLQDANYYPGGLSFSQLNDTEETDRLHCGKEWVDMEGLGWYDNTARFHDAILCRFTTPDPLAEQYPDLSPYSHCANNPLTIVDPDGMRLRVQDGDKYYYYHYDEDGYSGFYEETSGEAYNGDNEFIASLSEALKTLSSKTTGSMIVKFLANLDNKTVHIEDIENHATFKTVNARNSLILWDSSVTLSGFNTEGSREAPNYIILGHELSHAYGIWSVMCTSKESWPGAEHISSTEIYATHMENLLRMEHNIPLREFYEVFEYSDNRCEPNKKTRIIKSYKEGYRSIYYGSEGPIKLNPTPTTKRTDRSGYLYK